MKLKSRDSLPGNKEARAGCLSLSAKNGIIRTLPSPFYFTGMKTRLFAAFIFLSFAGTAAQASVYNCSSNGKSVYTSDPSGSCTGADLPKISSHQGGEYRLKIKKLSQETQIHIESKKKNKKTVGKKKKNVRTANIPKENQKKIAKKRSSSK
ncbi:hypothetical protein [Neisseria polysaccharea]|uniref:hypothetical protein n=1 Tax=Neisseria polysaccharea TaxID=489 RepID=UPI0027DF63A0|nr:hypothetical protein [Neisseria polysaccharea]